VFIISPKFCLKAPSGLGDPSIESLELTRGRFFWAVQEVPTQRLYVQVEGRKCRQYLPLSLRHGPEVLTSWSSLPVGCCSSRFCRKSTISSGGARAWSGSSDLLVVYFGRLLQCSVLLRFVRGCFHLASALLPSFASFVPKVSRFRLFVCDPRSCDWDTGRVLLRKNFHRLPFTPPSLVVNPVLQVVSEPVRVFIDSNQSNIQGWCTRNGVRILHTLMERTTRCGLSGWRCSSVERVRSFVMSRWTMAMSS
jgi:hypothetical protein